MNGLKKIELESQRVQNARFIAEFDDNDNGWAQEDSSDGDSESDDGNDNSDDNEKIPIVGRRFHCILL